MSVRNKDLAYIREKFNENEKFQNKTIFITGAAGFLGYYFAWYFASLAEANIVPKKIILTDNFMLGEKPWIHELLADMPEIMRGKVEIRDFDIISDDISNIDGVSEADYIIHLASIASPIFYRQYPIKTIDANVIGLRNIFEFYKEKSVSGILFFSSSEIYGDPTPDAIPTPEEYRGLVSCTGPRACYDEAKRVGETMCAAYSQEYGLPVGVARPFNNYGPGMNVNDKRLPADMAKNILENKDIEIFSNGKATRTFCYIADAITGYLKVLTHGKYDYFNIGNDQPEITVGDLAEIYKEIGRREFGYTGQVVFKESEDKHYLTDNPQRRCPNIDKARSVLGFDPSVTLEDGIKNYLQWCKEETNS